MSRILVAFFSASSGGATAGVGKRMAEAVGADVFAIVPEQPYTEAELNWKNPFARCNREKIGGKDVPFAGSAGDLSQYDLILIGFPIWYGGAPNVVRTFLRQSDFSGRRIGVFATSGGSKIGKSAEKLRPYLDGSTVIAGSRLFSPADSDETLAAWVRSCEA